MVLPVLNQKVIRLLLFTLILAIWAGQERSAAQCQIPADSVLVKVGEYCTVSGKVVSVFQSNKSDTKPVYLNIEKPYPNQVFEVVIFAKDVQNFSKHPRELYEGKKVKVSGVIELYNNRPQIIVKDPKYIEIDSTE
ncbi:hypothetical protein C7N43_02430 [Sphingobacteriales bacterium UPWRP_1]|nr:hypothetical protein B6N25_05930 [Sphingobacteriales bacterium TSM_CSS]PSJ78613.1 hypothetical protein C7N43_02430 [Sphingobacteriales bacterium UPWRP_1]